MTTREAKRAVRLRDWGMMVKQCQGSGLTVNEWCIQNNLKPACYYYRLSQVRKAVLNHSGLVPSADQEQTMPTLVKVDVTSAEQHQMPVSEASAERCFHLRYNRAVLNIPVGTGAEDIAEVLKAMRQYDF